MNEQGTRRERAGNEQGKLCCAGGRACAVAGAPHGGHSRAQCCLPLCLPNTHVHYTHAVGLGSNVPLQRLRRAHELQRHVLAAAATATAAAAATAARAVIGARYAVWAPAPKPPQHLMRGLAGLCPNGSSSGGIALPLCLRQCRRHLVRETFPLL